MCGWNAGVLAGWLGGVSPPLPLHITDDREESHNSCSCARSVHVSQSMPAERIDARSWAAFLEGFAAQHHGWLITVEQCDHRVIIGEEPLLDVRLDDGSIEISAGRDDRDRVGHRVEGVTDLFVDRVGADAISALRIVTASGETVLRFRITISPELVDGLV